MLKNIDGRVAWIFAEDNYDIDLIVGIENIKIKDIELLKSVCMTTYDPEFAKVVKPGDVIVGGKNFGYGHPHFPSFKALRALGIAAVFAEPFSPTYEGDKMPMAEVTLLPLTKSDCSIATEAWKLLLESDVILQDGMTFRQMTFDKYDLKVFAPTISETYTIGTVNKEFNSIDKIKSMKLRTSSRSQQLYTEALGCSAITMPAADLFDALSRGALDGAFLWIPDWPNFGLQNLFTNACEGLNIGHFPSVLAMTQERWDDLQPELKQLIIESVEKYRVSGAKGVVDAYEKVKKEAENVEFIHLSELPNDVQTYLIDAMEQTWYDYINLLETEGLPGTEVCRLWRDCIKEAGGEVPEGINNL